VLRALTNLRHGTMLIRKGDLIRESVFSAKTRGALIAQGRLAPVQGPPIAVVPQFEPYAASLAAHHIETVGELLDADAEECEDLPLASLQATATELVKPVCKHCGG